MAEKSFQEKTEQATPKKRDDARKKGQVSRSQELNSAVVLITGIIIIYMTMGHMIGKFRQIFESVYGEAGTIEISPEMALPYLRLGLQAFTGIVAPISLTIMAAGILVGYAQAGSVFSAQPLMPKWEKISPVSGLKKMFSQRSLVEGVKGILKVVIIGTVGFLTIRSSFDGYVTLIYIETAPLIAFIGSMVLKLVINVTIALLVLAVFDFGYQKWKYGQDLKMTKQEVKEENKQTEGDPLVKSRIKSVQREMARRRMMQEVPEADVIITNPTTYAVALKYDIEEMAAPTVVAKGIRKLAERIKEIGIEHDVTIVENKWLARTLYDTAEAGEEIPFDLFQAVAEVLAYVYKLRRGV